MKWNRSGKDAWRQMRGSSQWWGRSGGKVKERGDGNKISGTRAIDEREKSSEWAGQLQRRQCGSVCRASLMWWHDDDGVDDSPERTYHYQEAQLQRNFSPAATPSAGFRTEADLGGLRHLEEQWVTQWRCKTSPLKTEKERRQEETTVERRSGSMQGWKVRGSHQGEGCMRDSVRAFACGVWRSRGRQEGRRGSKWTADGGNTCTIWEQALRLVLVVNMNAEEQLLVHRVFYHFICSQGVRVWRYRLLCMCKQMCVR